MKSLDDHMNWKRAQLTIAGLSMGQISFLSYPRHQYFRRVLRDVLGELTENGEFPNDIKTLGQIVSDISYNNTKNYFGF